MSRSVFTFAIALLLSASTAACAMHVPQPAHAASDILADARVSQNYSVQVAPYSSKADLSGASVARTYAVFGGDVSAGLDVSLGGVPLVEGEDYIVRYYAVAQSGERGSECLGAFATGQRYIASVEGVGNYTGSQDVVFYAFDAIDFSTAEGVSIAVHYAYTGLPVELRVSIREGDADVLIPPKYYAASFYPVGVELGTASGADATADTTATAGSSIAADAAAAAAAAAAADAEIPAPAAIGDYQAVVIGQGRCAGRLPGEGAVLISIHRTVDIGKCSLVGPYDMPEKSWRQPVQFEIRYPDSEEVVPDSLYSTLIFDEEGALVSTDGAVQKAGTYRLVVQGNAELGCSGQIARSFKVVSANDLSHMKVQFFNKKGNPVSKEPKLTYSGENQVPDYKVGYDNGGLFVEVDPLYYSVSVVDDRGVQAAKHSSVGGYTLIASGENGWVGSTSSHFTIVNAAGNTKDSYSLYRLYNRYTGEHFFTASKKECTRLGKVGWRYEGVAWKSPSSGVDAYRLYNPFSGDHHYTTSSRERRVLMKKGWVYEGVGWTAAKKGKSVYRLYNPWTTAFYHHYTVEKREYVDLMHEGWEDEGVGWRGLKP